MWFSGDSGKESVREEGLKKQERSSSLKAVCLRSLRHGLHSQQSPCEAQQGLPTSPQEETQEGVCVCVCVSCCLCLLLSTDQLPLSSLLLFSQSQLSLTVWRSRARSLYTESSRMYNSPPCLTHGSHLTVGPVPHLDHERHR